MELQLQKWFTAIHNRRSRRTFISKKIEVEKIKVLKEVIEIINISNNEVRLVLVEKSPDELLIGTIGPYGKITAAPTYVAVVGDLNGYHCYERAGYSGQGIVLEANNHGISSCWIAGYFNNELAAKELEVKKSETVIAIIPLGYARKNYSLTEKMMNQVGDYHKRKPIRKIVSGLPMEKWPNWIATSIQAASLAPSAYNRQPFQYIIGTDHSITIATEKADQETNIPIEIDLGIVMLHIELAARHHLINWEWDFIENEELTIFREITS
jgi:nitroreductase